MLPKPLSGRSLLEERIKAQDLNGYIQDNLFTLCSHVISPDKMGTLAHLDFDQIACIVAKVDSFGKNLELFEYLSRKITSHDAFFQLFRESGNEHVIQILEKKLNASLLPGTLSDLLNTPNATVIVSLNNESDKTEHFRVNACALAQFSSVLKNRLETVAVNNDGKSEVPVGQRVDENGERLFVFTDIHPKSFEIILEYFSKNAIDEDKIREMSVCRLFHDSRVLDVWEVQKITLEIIAKEVKKFLEDREPADFFEIEDWIQILSRDDLQVPRELWLVDVIWKWLQEFKENCNSITTRDRVQKRLLEQIRFQKMTVDELIYRVQPLDILPFEQLYDAVLKCLGRRKRYGPFQKARRYTASVTENVENSDVLFDADVEAAQKALKEGGKLLKFDDRYKDVIIVLGNTGAGKTTLCQILSDDNAAQLKSAALKGKRFEIRDSQGKIGKTFSILSHSTYPDLIVASTETQAPIAFYDCPGFGETRTVHLEIANSFLIKSVAGFSERIKILLVVSFCSVSEPAAKSDFTNLIQHTLNVVGNIKKYGKSIGLLVNQVYRQDLSDQDVLEIAADFLKTASIELEQKGWSQDLKERARQLIQCLLEDDPTTEVDGSSNCYSRIRLLRCPSTAGILLDDSTFSIFRRDFLTFLRNSLSYVSTSPEDFGHCLSAEALNIRIRLIDRLHEGFKETISQISRALKDIYLDEILDFVEFLDHIIKPSLTDGTLREELDLDVHRFKPLVHDLAILEQSLTRNTVQNLSNTPELIDHVQSVSEKLALKHSKGESLFDELLNSARNLQKSLDFLSQLQEDDKGRSSNLDLLSLTDSLTSLIDLFSFLFPFSLRNDGKFLKKLMDYYDAEIVKSINCLVVDLKRYYTESLFNGPRSQYLDTLHGVLEHHFFEWAKILPGLKLADNPHKLSDEIHQVILNFPDSNWAPPFEQMKAHLQAVTRVGDHLQLFQNLLGDSTTHSEQMQGDCKILTDPLDKSLLPFIKESELWYSFLKELYKGLSSYAVQKAVSCLNENVKQTWLGELKDLLKANDRITNRTLHDVIQRLTREYALHIAVTVPTSLLAGEHQLGEDYENSRRFNELVSLLTGALCHRVSLRREGTDKVVVQGRFIIFSKVLVDTQNLQNVNFVEIYSSEIIFIDEDFDANGQSLCIAICSPIWEIVGNFRKIALDGKPGQNGADALESPPASFPGDPFYFKGSRQRARVISAGDGHHGDPGNPGETGGAFLGVGLKFVKSENLLVSVNGGAGGRGGNGGAGKPGNRGEDAVQPQNGTEEPPNCGFGYDPASEGTRTGLGRSGSLFTKQFKIYGRPAVFRGGRGGHGGTGGPGGMPGSIKLIFQPNADVPDNIPSIGLNQLPGAKGADGQGGQGGAGGQSGQSILVQYQRRKTKSFIGSVNGTQYTWTTISLVDDSQGNTESGSNGLDGSNSAGTLQPSSTSQWDDIERISSLVLRNFTQFLRENLQSIHNFRLTLSDMTLEQCLDTFKTF